MTLSAGNSVGPYDIVAPLGAGGMGEVYRAHDTRLKRDVALKVLPEALSQDVDRLARLKREAQVLASLNHPHIASIYGVEESGPTLCLVLELVEGDTLAERLRRGALPIDDAIRLARQLADALGTAHESGIIHRDLKPANIALTADDQVKVLDFGLARAIDPALPDAASSPTPRPVATQDGVILGTAAYMSPEQAKGRAADKRSDVWAFGCVFYEMLTGVTAFQGEDVLDTLTAVMRSEPDWSALPARTPAHVRALLERCLKKNRKERIADIAVAQFLLDTGSAAAGTSRSPAARVLPWALFAAASTVVVAMLLTGMPGRSARPAAPRTMVMLTGTAATLRADRGDSNIALSPDGTTLAFVAQEAVDSRLFLRKLDQLQATPLAGTEGAGSPFFSPDGRWIAFLVGGVLRKVPVSGGDVIGLCEAFWAGGGAWAEDDMIILSSKDGQGARLMQVPAAGGTPVTFGTPTGATTQRWPQALPGGKGVLFTENASRSGFEGATLVVAPRSGGTPKIVVRGAYFGRYVPGSLASPGRGDGGHLIYIRKGALFAVRFDLDRLETIGEEAPVLEAPVTSSELGSAHLAVSREGTLAYLPAAFATDSYPLHWMTRDGKASVLRATRAEWANPRFSPDGTKLAIDISDGKQRDIWVYEWARDTLTQLTFDQGNDSWPVWTPDGRRIAFGSDRAQPGVPNMYWVNADGTGEVTRLHESPRSELPLSWHPSGKFLTYTLNTGGANRSDSMILPMGGDAVRGFTPGKPFAFLNTPAADVYSMFSPDGRWIAYAETTANGSPGDVYVRPFPGPGGPWRISTDRGAMPDWSASGHELLFLNVGTNTIMFVNYSVVGDSFRADKPQVFQPTSFMRRGWGSRRFAIHPDGKRLALVALDPSVVQDKVALFFNFGDYLQTITAGKK